jgi:hypothetical protein
MRFFLPDDGVGLQALSQKSPNAILPLYTAKLKDCTERLARVEAALEVPVICELKAD